MREVLLCTALLFGIFPASAQDITLNIEVDHTGNDVVGETFAYVIREQFRKSEAFNVTSEGPRITLMLLTMSSDQYSTSTTYSVVWALKNEEEPLPTLLDHQVGRVGEDRLETSARNMLAATDEMRMLIQKMERQYQSDEE